MGAPSYLAIIDFYLRPSAGHLTLRGVALSQRLQCQLPDSIDCGAIVPVHVTGEAQHHIAGCFNNLPCLGGV